MSLLRKGGLARSTGWMLIGQGSGYLLRVVYFIILARLLGVVQYGIVVGAFALVNIVAQYSRMGSGMVMLRYVSAEHSRFAAYWANLLVITGTVSGLLVLLLHFVAPRLIGAASASIIVLTALGSVLFEQLSISATQVYQAHENMPVTAGLNLLTSLARAGAAVFLLIRLHHATAQQWALASMLASGAVTVIALAMATIRFGIPRLDRSLLHARWREGLEYAFAASTTTAYDDVDKAMLSHYGMNAAAGVYAMAYRIIDMATMPISALQLAAEPRLFKLAHEGSRGTVELGRRLLSKGFLVSLAVSVGLYFVAPVIPHLVGRSFTDGVEALRWLCLIPLFRSVHYLTGSTLTCLGLQRFRTWHQIIAATFNFGINLYLIPRFGWRGAAWSSLMTDAALGLLNLAALTLHTRRSVSVLVEEAC